MESRQRFALFICSDICTEKAEKGGKGLGEILDGEASRAVEPTEES